MERLSIDLPAAFADEELATAAATIADMLRVTAKRWRARHDGGRVSEPRRSECARLIGSLEAAASLVEQGGASEEQHSETPAQNASGMNPDERFQSIVENIRDYAIMMLDPEGRIESWNRGAERINGYRSDEILGKRSSVLYPPDEVAAGTPEEELRTALREGHYETEGWRVRKDGGQYWANVVVTAIFDQRLGHIGFTKITRDCTERRTAEEKLRQSEQTFRLLVDSVRDYAIFMLDQSGVITSWNAGAEHLKGYRADEVIGKHFSVFYTEPDRRRAHPDEELRRARSEGVYREEGWRVRQDGTIFWASVVITAIFNASGENIGFAKVTRDMSERRNAEESLQKMNESLQMQVRQQTAAVREVEAFSYSVSHDLRAPLRALDGFSRLLLEKCAGRLDAQEQDYLRRIREASKQMSQLIDAMLALSRLTRTPLEPATVDVSAQVRAAAAELQSAEPERQTEFVIAEGLRTTADPRLLKVIWENLLRNAWKFSRNAAHPRIEVGVAERDGARAFFVRDNGVGLDMAQAHRLFIPFQRLHRAKDFEGTGIGLATVNRIVQLHDGRIWVDSERGRGATFYFTLEGIHGEA
jgi:PAS domain S-box-containing protein